MLAGAVAALIMSVGAASAEALRLIGQYELPAGLSVVGVPFGGISALDYDAETGLFLALSDDRGRHGPPRFYTLALSLETGGIAGVDIRAQTPIRLEEGRAPEPGEIDPEAMRVGPDGALYWAQEGGAARRPTLGVMGRDGAQIAAFELPAYYLPPSEAEIAADAPAKGVRRNMGPEALAVDAEGRVILGLEQALVQDGPAADVAQGSLARILTLSPTSGGPVAEHLYPISRTPALPIPADGFQTNGLTALLQRPGGGFYALERAFVAGQGGFAAIYKTSFEGATNVLGAATLEGLSPTPMRKELLYSLMPRPGLPRIDNVEGMSFGPKIDGARTLVVISDDNFSGLEAEFRQVTQILLFAIEE
ncbi:MAG: esterase-like activity of phytase family protein [Pseudomonadota bacterium]